METVKISIYVNTAEEIIGIKEDFAAYCEKFGDVLKVDVEGVGRDLTDCTRMFMNAEQIKLIASEVDKYVSKQQTKRRAF